MLDRTLRFFGTALSFAVFGVGGLLLTLFVFPVILLMPGSDRLRQYRARKLLSGCFRLFIRMMHALGVLDLDLGDLSVLNTERGTVIVANHPTLIDVVLLLAYIEQGNCVVKRNLWRNPFLGGVVRAARYIPNVDSNIMLAECERVLRAGETLVVFPEGTRTRPEQPVRMRRGAAAIALRANAPLRLVHIRCRPSTLTKAEPWYRIPPRRPCFSLRVGERLEASDFLSDGIPPSVATRRLTAVLQQQLTRDVFARPGLAG